MDPFGATCDPRLYVPRLGTEAALRALKEGFASGRLVSLLSGPPGLGKTMVLRMLPQQLACARCAYLPYTALGIEELALVSLDALGEEAASDSATIALAACARRVPEAPLVLLLDDACALPAPSARALRELVEALDGALRLVAAAAEDTRSLVALASLGDDALNVGLRHPLTPHEANAYVRGRLMRAGASAAERALQDEHIALIAAESAGVPRDINTLASLMLRAQSEAGKRAAGSREIDPVAPANPAPEASPLHRPRRRRRLRRTRGW
jgi:type II secretory pathway predicted ATPase ExeA